MVSSSSWYLTEEGLELVNPCERMLQLSYAKPSFEQIAVWVAFAKHDCSKAPISPGETKSSTGTFILSIHMFEKEQTHCYAE